MTPFRSGGVVIGMVRLRALAIQFFLTVVLVLVPMVDEDRLIELAARLQGAVIRRILYHLSKNLSAALRPTCPRDMTSHNLI